MTPYHHALSSSKKFGGSWEQYIKIHQWFDESKYSMGDFRHRALRHHTQGIKECEEKFGVILIIQPDDKEIPVKWVAEQHVIEDCGFLPTPKDWLECLAPKPWMRQVQEKPKVNLSL